MIISLANQKGGVSKTTVCSTLGQGLKQLHDKNVLFIDLDQQGNLSECLSADTENKPTIADLLGGKCKVKDSIQITCSGWSVIPSDSETSLFNIGLPADTLSKIIEPIKNDYDYILIDNAPTLSALTINSFVCSDKVIIPTNAGVYATQGIQQLYEVIEHARTLNNRLVIDGILLTKYSGRSIIQRQIKDALLILASNMSTKVYNATIRQAIVVEETQALKQSLFDYAGKSAIAGDYKLFINELIEREEVR